LENPDDYNNILITDITDVFFQNDPFLGLDDEFIYFAEEDEDHTIGSNSFNSRWVHISLGLDNLNKIKDQKIICAGTTLGSYQNILQYLSQITLFLKDVKDKNPLALNESVDQGVHNFICYQKTEVFKNPLIRKNGDLIATVGITSIDSPNKISISEDVVSVNGKIPSIIHQYNRSSEITSLTYKKYK
jgi:hypothetical protein